MTGLGDQSQWESAIKEFTIDHPVPDKLDLVDISMKYKESEMLSLCEQFLVLSGCPNTHRWMAKKNHGVKKNEYFLPVGKSQRNQLMLDILTSKEILGDEDNMCSILDHMSLIVGQVVINEYYMPSLPERIVRKNVRLVTSFLIVY